MNISKRYRFTLQKEYIFKSDLLLGVYFYNDWLVICDGVLRISKGYSWDGCTFAPDSEQTYIASCVHDACYQFNFITRQRADLAFYDLLKQNKFPLAKFYYISVRLFGFLFY